MAASKLRARCARSNVIQFPARNVMPFTTCFAPGRKRPARTMVHGGGRRSLLKMAVRGEALPDNVICFPAMPEPKWPDFWVPGYSREQNIQLLLEHYRQGIKALPTLEHPISIAALTDTLRDYRAQLVKYGVMAMGPMPILR